MSNSNGTFWRSLKRGAVNLLGREKANRLSSPYHDWRARRRTRQFLDNLPTGDLCINLGCGHRPMKGWVNIDRARGPEVQVVWDLTKGLPFPDASCAAIFSEHMIEHLPRAEAAQLLRECHRILKPGSVFRISTPDAQRYLRSYAGDGDFLHHPGFARPFETRLERINQMMREYGQHLWVYDAESLLLALGQAGFNSATERQFGESADPRLRDIDSVDRAFETLYVEAIK